MSWSGWYLRNSSISANLRSVIGVATPFRWLVVLLLEGNAPVTFSVNHRPDSTGFYTLPGTLTQGPPDRSPPHHRRLPGRFRWGKQQTGLRPVLDPGGTGRRLVWQAAFLRCCLPHPAD